MSQHIVKQGDCLSSIAADYGFEDWQIIYDDPANAELRASRPDPNLLYPGDSLYIPDLDPGASECQTDQQHVFVLKRKPTYIKVRLQDPAKQPIKNVPYKLVLDTMELEGTTDGDGWVKSEIPPQTTFGTLIVWPDPADETEMSLWRVNLGHLDPLETTTGVKGRLNNLGYDCGEVNDEEGDFYDAAVRRFQKDHGLVVDGIVGPQTRDRLRNEHKL
jgi:Putative peptidoglycan binding domain/LysM domain